MLKPVIYYQFDNDENERAASKRWFDFEKDGFGPICRKSTEVIKILHELENTRLGEKYQKRVKEMFPIRDLPGQLENVQQSGNEIAERGMPT